MRNNSVNKRQGATGRFAVGNPGNPGNRNGGGRPSGTPNKSAWIRQQIQETCGCEAIERLRMLGESDDPRRLATYWGIICKTLPAEVQAEVGGPGWVADAADAALARFHETHGIQDRTELGDM